MPGKNPPFSKEGVRNCFEEAKGAGYVIKVKMGDFLS